MLEFLIRRTDGEWFDLHQEKFASALKPNSLKSKVVAGWGDHRISVDGCEISFSYEDPGIQICIENDIDETKAQLIVDEILENITRVTGQEGRVIPL